MLWSRSVAQGVLVVNAAACGTLSDLGVAYDPCVPVEYPYIEEFRDDFQTLTDHCWHPNADARQAKYLVADGDLVIRPGGDARWAAKTQAPSATLTLAGDFLFVTRAEALSSFASDHCALTAADTAGIVAYDGKSGSFTTLTIRPFLEESGVECQDDSKHPPRAIVEIRDVGFEGGDQSLNGVGADGEGDIALCRQGNQLAYFYRDFDEPNFEVQWKLLGRKAIRASTLEVGLTTTGQEVRGIEGHFPWVIVPYQGQGEGCSETLAKLKLPGEG